MCIAAQPGVQADRREKPRRRLNLGVGRLIERGFISECFSADCSHFTITGGLRILGVPYRLRIDLGASFSLRGNAGFP